MSRYRWWFVYDADWDEILHDCRRPIRERDIGDVDTACHFCDLLLKLDLYPEDEDEHK